MSQPAPAPATLEDIAREDIAHGDTALGDQALKDTALKDTALEQIPHRDTALGDLALKDLDPWDGMAYASIDLLTPFFITSMTGRTYARYAAAEAIAAYKPQSRADYANIGRTVALSLLVMAIGAKAAAADVPLELQLKILSRLQAISRAADATETLMMKRRAEAWADGSHRQPEGLIGRQPNEASPYPPLPASDPASGRHAAMLQAKMAARTPAAVATQAAPAAAETQAPAAVPESRPRPSVSRPQAQQRRSAGGLDQAISVEAPCRNVSGPQCPPAREAAAKSQPRPAMNGGTRNAAIQPAAATPASRAHPDASGPETVTAAPLPRHESFEAFVRDALSATGGISPEVEDLLREFGLPPLGLPSPESPRRPVRVVRVAETV